MKEKGRKRKFSAFQIATTTLIILLLIGIFVQIIIMTSLKDRSDNIKKETSQIPDTPPQKTDSILENYFQNIEKASVKQ